jgi:uncharacterized membrane protein YbhN (UPF0104 family)
MVRRGGGVDAAGAALVTEHGARERSLFTPGPPRRWIPAVFGVVNEGANRRRPTDIVRAGLATIIVFVTATGAHTLAVNERRTFELLTDLPDWLRPVWLACYWLGTSGVVIALLLALLFARRFRIVGLLVAAAAAAAVVAGALRAWVDAGSVRGDAGMSAHGAVPEYPIVVLAVATAVLVVVAPYLLRPARRLVYAALWTGAAGAVGAIVGLPDDVIGALAIGWGVAAILHLAVGSPAANPSVDQVSSALDGLRLSVHDLRLDEPPVWGESRYRATAPDGTPLAIDVIGRDASDARLFAKIGRSIWYKDSGPSLALTRSQQLEHRAYILLIAERSGVRVSEVVLAGISGAHETAVMVQRVPEGERLVDADPARITDAVLDDAWQNLMKLHEVHLAHGSMRASNVVVRDDGTTACVNFAHASSDAPPERCALDSAGLLATTASIVGNERALDAAERALGAEGLNLVLPLLASAAMPAATRKEIPDTKASLAALREQGGTLTGQPAETLTELRRVSPGTLLMAAGAMLGIYLLIGEVAGIDFSEVFDNAEWDWVVLAFLLSPLPQFTSSISLMGAVAAPLPFRPVLGEQFANNFTGLVGGTVASTALVIRFFQKQGQKVAVAVSSGLLNSLAAGMIQTVLVVVGLLLTSSDFTPSSTGGEGAAGLIIVLFIVAVIAVSAILFIPKIRARIKRVVAPQWKAGRENLTGILTTPRKAVMLFGGNLASQVIFALVLDASLHAYGGSLPLMQLIVINSLASVLGGMAPVPGGMGVVEAGLIAGLTAAGIPQETAVAATFTHRTFTAYLPPIWGWFALQWLRRNDYV